MAIWHVFGPPRRRLRPAVVDLVGLAEQWLVHTAGAVAVGRDLGVVGSTGIVAAEGLEQVEMPAVGTEPGWEVAMHNVTSATGTLSVKGEAAVAVGFVALVEPAEPMGAEGALVEGPDSDRSFGGLVPGVPGVRASFGMG
jgi:hypothetical protein